MSDLPAKMRAVVFTAAQKAELLDWDCSAQPLGADEIAGRTLASLISPGTEISHAYGGFEGSKAKFPTLSGYATIVEIDAVGAGVKDLVVGDRVFMMGPHTSRQRGPRAGAIPVPRSLTPDVAVFGRLMGVTWSTLVTTTARPADRVLVTGLGPVGNLGAQIFRAAGFRVTAVDPVETRRRLAQRAGLEDVRDSVPLGDPTVAGTFALAVECSGHEQAVFDACKAVKKRGEVVLVGVPWRRRADLQAFDVLHAVFHRYVVLRSGWEWEVPRQPADFVTGSINGNIAAAIDWLAQGRVKVEGLYAAMAPAECQFAYQDLLHQRGEAISIVFDWSRL